MVISVISRAIWILTIAVAASLSANVSAAERALAKAKPTKPAAEATMTIDPRPPFAPAVVISGNARERGRAYGKLHKQGIHEFLDTYIYQTLIGHPSSKEEMLAYARACGQVTREVCPMVAEEMAGIAEGADMPFEEIVLLMGHEEVYHRAELPKEGHCTAVAVAPSDSGDGHAYVAQTWDWMTTLAGKSIVTEWRRDEAPSVLAYGFTGLPMGAGMNSQGIALTWTSCALSKKGESPRIGVPSYALIMHLLAQNDMEAVIREANRDKHAGWFTFVMSDAKGNLVNIEGSPKGVAIERRQDNLVRHDFGTPEMTGTKPGQQVNHTSLCKQLNRLLDSTKGKNDLLTLENYLTQPKNEIVQWKSPRNKTIDVMIFDTTARKAFLSRGPYYNIEWREFSFTP